MHPAPFLLILDRDGTVIRDEGYLCDPDLVVFETAALEGLIALSRLGAVIVVVTNQSGVGRGFFSETNVEAVNARISDLLAAYDVRIEGYYVCPHRPDEFCSCRKPKPALGLKAAMKQSLPLSTAVVVGDKLSDVEFALNLGALGVLVRTGEGFRHEQAAKANGHLVVNSLLELSEIMNSNDWK